MTFKQFVNRFFPEVKVSPHHDSLIKVLEDNICAGKNKEICFTAGNRVINSYVKWGTILECVRRVNKGEKVCVATRDPDRYTQMVYLVCGLTAILIPTETSDLYKLRIEHPFKLAIDPLPCELSDASKMYLDRVKWMEEFGEALLNIGVNKSAQNHG